MMRYGVDLGGTKIELAALSASGEMVWRQRRTTPRGDYAATVAAIAQLVNEARQRFGAGSVGLGIPGTIGAVGTPSENRVKNANSTWLIGQPLADDLAQALGQPVRIANDADCFALSEATDGAGAGAASVFGVILGTGVGGGIVIGGRCLSGPNAICGEWGHNPLPWRQEDDPPPPPCYCGRRDCIETHLSGPGLLARHQQRNPGTREQSVEDIVRSSDPACLDTLERTAQTLARALASVINLLDPHVIVLGGGVSRIASLYQRVPAVWGQWVFSDSVQTRLLPARWGDSSGVRGAAWLWDDQQSQGIHRHDPQQSR